MKFASQSSKEKIKEEKVQQEVNRVEKIQNQLVQYANENNLDLLKEGKTYTLTLEKGTELDLKDNYFLKKEITSSDSKKIIYSDEDKEEKFILDIKYFERPKLAILIDDVGMNTKTASYFLNIDKPISFAVLPQLPKTKEASKILRDNGFEVILHMPMEGSNDILNERTENLLWSNMSDKEIYDTFDKAIESVGSVSGFNNHMGSRFTGNSQKMKVLLQYAKRKNLYFIDSNTNSKREGYRLSKDLQMPSYYTSYFIDNSHSKEDVKEGIKKAVEMAKQHKKILVIGHYRKDTGEAIFEMLDYINEQGVKLVSIKDVLE